MDTGKRLLPIWNDAIPNPQDNQQDLRFEQLCMVSGSE